MSIEDLGKWMVLWDITWYNPPWNCNVKTSLGKKFLHIVDKCFPKNHPLIAAEFHFVHPAERDS